MISLQEAHELSNIPYVTLKMAAQRYARTGGKSGLRAIKKKGSPNWWTTRRALDNFKQNEWNENRGKKPE
jgi:hypothetical protein